MGWALIIVAATFEMIGVAGLRFYNYYKKFPYMIVYIGGFGLSFLLLFLSFCSFDISTAYAVWTGLGTAGAVGMNMIFFGESHSLQRVISLALIIFGVVGLKIIS